MTAISRLRRSGVNLKVVNCFDFDAKVREHKPRIHGPQRTMRMPLFKYENADGIAANQDRNRMRKAVRMMQWGGSWGLGFMAARRRRLQEVRQLWN